MRVVTGSGWAGSQLAGFTELSGRRRAAMAGICLALILLAVAVQVMHHCTALDINQEPGGGPVYCPVCMTMQVATMAFAVLVVATIRRLPGTVTTALPRSVPRMGAALALSVRPPPSL